MSSFFKRSPALEACFSEHGERITYDKNQHLVWKSDESAWVFMLASGLVRVSFSFDDGQQRVIGYFVPGVVFAQSGSFFAEHDGALSYIAEGPVTVYRMKRSEFLLMLDTSNNHMCVREYLDMTLRNQIFLIDRIVYQGEKGLEAKFRRWLLFMVKYYGQKNDTTAEISVSLTQEMIADFLHTTRESVNVLLKESIQKRIIKIEKKKIVILDLARLEKKVWH